MRRLFTILIAVLVLYAIYHDLTEGSVSLPEKTTEEPAVPASTSPNVNIPFKEKTVKPGDTVLSIVEKNSSGPLPVSISKVISDFQKLNEGVKPEEIQIGKAYKFPKYKKAD
ncbi:LysM peptidoglycan-binding domain-containing protein [Bacillus marasmi]|uniref:LysM peptidoglycan-binding domain-containing protein n=1 Tax=Bacillus marasmi TaxID=1926279 RepID=UPI0011CB6B3D|nr:LysM domain-containing protein [Bacillus marasmi]